MENEHTMLMIVSLVAIVGIVAIVIGINKGATQAYTPPLVASSGGNIAENTAGEAIISPYKCTYTYICYNQTGYNSTNSTSYCKWVKTCDQYY